MVIDDAHPEKNRVNEMFLNHHVIETKLSTAEPELKGGPKIFSDGVWHTSRKNSWIDFISLLSQNGNDMQFLCKKWSLASVSFSPRELIFRMKEEPAIWRSWWFAQQVSRLNIEKLQTQNLLFRRMFLVWSAVRSEGTIFLCFLHGKIEGWCKRQPPTFIRTSIGATCE